MSTVTRGLGSPRLLTGGLGPAAGSGQPGPSPGPSVVTRGLGGSGLVVRGMLAGAGSGGVTPAAGTSAPGYFTAYFPGYFTGYFPGAGGRPAPAGLVSPVGAAPTGYFTGFFPGYFTGYFPGAGGVLRASPVVVIPAYPDFLSAVRGTLLADGALAGMLRGGVWHRYAPRFVPAPYLDYAVRVDGRVNSSYKAFTEHGSIRFTAYAAADEVARAIADRAVDVLTDAPMRWDQYDGRLMYLSLDTPLSEDLPAGGVGGARYFALTRVLDFVYQGREAGAT